MKKIIAVLFILCSTCSFAQTDHRIALVVGNSNYGRSNYLKNPVNDADSIAKKLKPLGFEVILLKDASCREMDSSISVFGRKAAKYDVALFYYSGHGIQAKGENYLIPVDASLDSESDVRYKCTSLGFLLDKLDESGCPMKIVVLDACRDNPFAKGWYRGPGQQGLQSVTPPKGTFITFSTAAGSVAQDGTGSNSPYTTAFLAALDKPNLSLYEFFEEVGQNVLSATHDEQDPWTNHSTLQGNHFYFNLLESEENVKKPSPKDFSVKTVGRDLEFTVRGVTFKMIYVEGGTFNMGCTAEQGTDCIDDERPSHRVTVDSYYMGETEVTQALWRAVMRSEPTYNNKGWNDEYGRGDDYPAYYVSWGDCKDFIVLLNQMTGMNFRLPTEAEWEYAARGGKYHSNYKYAGSDNLDEVAWQYQNSGDKHLPLPATWGEFMKMIDINNHKMHVVKTKSPNALKLYDMSGNVIEWCEDAYGDYTSTDQSNPKGSTSYTYRVTRGGGYLDPPKTLRVSCRLHRSPTSREDSLGFRLSLYYGD